MADRCKFQKYQYQVSYDNGSTWENVTPIQVEKGDIIEYMSQDCSEIQTLYRWVDLEGTYLCDGNNKYTRQIQEESYDNGVSWYASYPTVYQRGTFVGVDEEYCADKFVGDYVYVTPTPTHGCGSGIWNGFKCKRLDPLKVVKCDGNSALTTADTTYYVDNYELISAVIGNCVSSIGNAFNGRSRLTSIDIPNNITSIDNAAFAGCTSLTSCTIGSGVTTIGNNAFYNCRSLTSVNIPNSVTSMGSDVFHVCYKLTSATIGNSVTEIGKDTFSYCTGLTNISIGTSVTSIGNSAFTSCWSLTSVNIPNNVTSIGWHTFYDCRSLTSVTIGTGVTRITYHAFQKCISLTNIEIPNTVTNIGISAFDSCSGLTSVNIPNSVTIINDSAFYNCISLTSVTIGSGVAEIGYDAFNGCRSLASVVVRNTTPPTLYSGAFSNTSNSLIIYVPSASVNTYKSASGWSTYADRIQPIP